MRVLRTWAKDLYSYNSYINPKILTLGYRAMRANIKKDERKQEIRPHPRHHTNKKQVKANIR